MDDLNRLPCLSCGNWYDLDSSPSLDGNCKPCHEAYQERRGKALYAFKKKYGYKPESHKKRARKAYYTRLANLSITDPERFKRLFKSLKQRNPHQAAQVTRKINQREAELCSTS